MADIQIHRTLDEATEQPNVAHACACGDHDETLPELDVQTIPPCCPQKALRLAAELM